MPFVLLEFVILIIFVKLALLCIKNIYRKELK